MLPIILIKTALLVIVCILAAASVFCVLKISRSAKEFDNKPMVIGYAAGENALTDTAAAYVQEMESVKSLCCLEAVAYDEGMARLKKKELEALIILPDNVINEILSGSNAHAKVYLPGDTGAVKSLVFRELAVSGINMLQTAQAEIYAVLPLVFSLSGSYADENFIQPLYDDINRFNLSVVTGRGDVFKRINLSATGNDTYTVYYGSALVTVYMLLSGLFFGSFYNKGRIWQDLAYKRLGVSYACQLLSSSLSGFMLMIAVSLLPLILLAAIADVFYMGLITVFFIIIMCSLYFMLIYRLVENHRTALLIIGILAVLQAYVSGCIIPSALLPDAVSAVGSYVPASFIKAGFTIFMTGRKDMVLGTIYGLSAWSFVFFVLARLSMNLREKNENIEYKTKKRSVPHIPAPFTVLLKRMLYRKSIWLSLIFMAAASIFISRIEKGSDTTVTAAVYDGSGEYVNALKEYDGLVRFVLCGSSGDVKKMVLKGETECGYVIPDGMTKNLISGKAKRSINMYKDADAVTSGLVDEVLFNIIFRKASLSWYEDYMNEKAGSIDNNKIDAAFFKQLNNGSTFDIEFETVDLDGGNELADKTHKKTYPVMFVVIITVVLCFISGVIQAADDYRQHRFYKRSRLKMGFITILQPTLMGGVFGVLTVIAVFMQ